MPQQSPMSTTAHLNLAGHQTGPGKSRPSGSAASVPASLLAGLGVIGLEPIEPVVLAALAGGEPLLLIGPHGTAKSYLLSRICVALRLEWRHYNASLLNFDDLVGYPLPGPDGSLRYVQTPSSIWGAQAVFLDEISRCRLDMQNKLFPIIHERRVQGIELERLVYRWSAMNPPATDEQEPDEYLSAYRGSEPLDPALADRFAFIVQMPAWDSLSESQQQQVILATDEPPAQHACERLRRAVGAARDLLPVVREQMQHKAAGYVRVVVNLLRQAGIELSPRRAGTLLRNIVAVHACSMLHNSSADPALSTLLALSHSIPQRAIGIKVDEVKLLAAHREAWQLAGLEGADPRVIVYLETDPLKRALRAMAMGPAIPQSDFSAIVADALADLPAGGRHALATVLLESPAVDRLLASVAEQSAALYAMAATPQETRAMVDAGGKRHKTWQRITERLGRMTPDEPETILVTNLLVGLFEANELEAKADVDRTLASWNRVRQLARGALS